MRHQAFFTATIFRNDEEIELEGHCVATGHNNQDVGGGGTTELDTWELENWDEEDLSPAEIEEIELSAQNALDA